MSGTVPLMLEALIDVDPQQQTLCTAFGMIRSVRAGQTAQSKRFVDLDIADQSTTLAAKIWDDRPQDQELALALPIGRPIKILFQTGTYRDTVQLNIKGLREISSEDEGVYRPEAVFGEGIDLVQDLVCETLVFDIETVPAQDRRELPSTVGESLVKFAEYKEMESSALMGMSPFFGKVVSLAFGEGETDLEDQRITALVVPPEGREDAEFPENIRPMSEADLLRAFWSLASAARTVVTYNGRGFDVPFIVNRSLIHRIPSRVDLLSNRYSLRPHLDLLQVLRHGSYKSGGPTTLDVVCWALGIESPKGKMDGSMVAPAYDRGEIEEIARYNLADVRATTAVYQRLRTDLLQFRRDW